MAAAALVNINDLITAADIHCSYSTDHSFSLAIIGFYEY